MQVQLQETEHRLHCTAWTDSAHLQLIVPSLTCRLRNMVYTRGGRRRNRSERSSRRLSRRSQRQSPRVYTIGDRRCDDRSDSRCDDRPVYRLRPIGLSCGGFTDAHSRCHGFTVALCLWIRREKIAINELNARVALQLSEQTVTPAPCTAECPSRPTLAI